MMSEQELKEQVINTIANHKTGVLSSVENNKPHTRYMTFYNEDLTLFTPTKLDTEKIDEIKNNPNVAVLIGYEGNGIGDTYVEITGTSTINKSQEVKERFWEESFNKWFEGPNDPNYVFLEIQPETVRILNDHGEAPKELHM